VITVQASYGLCRLSTCNHTTAHSLIPIDPQPTPRRELSTSTTVRLTRQHILPLASCQAPQPSLWLRNQSRNSLAQRQCWTMLVCRQIKQAMNYERIRTLRAYLKRKIETTTGLRLELLKTLKDCINLRISLSTSLYPY
jgi:hypothetical protein